MSDSSLIDEQRSKRSPPSSGSWKRRLLRAAVFVLGPYLFLCAMLGFLQRKLIYQPFKVDRIRTLDAGLPEGRVHDVSVRAADGIELHGWHILAEGHSAQDRNGCDAELAQGRPVVLYFSGNAGNRQWRIDECRVFTGSGADVFLFDYRGYGDNAGSPSEEAFAADARTVWNYAVDERQVAAERIVIYGESIGGGVAVRLAAEMCEAGTPPGGLITRSTFSSLVDAASYHYPWLPVNWLLLDRYRSDEKIGAITCPILMLHGNNDRIVPLRLGRKLFDAAPGASAGGLKKRFVELDGGDHNGLLMTHGREIHDAVRDFLTTIQGEISE